MLHLVNLFTTRESILFAIRVAPLHRCVSRSSISSHKIIQNEGTLNGLINFHLNADNFQSASSGYKWAVGRPDYATRSLSALSHSHTYHICWLNDFQNILLECIYRTNLCAATTQPSSTARYRQIFEWLPVSLRYYWCLFDARVCVCVCVQCSDVTH